MFISVFDLFKIGIGPSSSHTVGPMRAAYSFVDDLLNQNDLQNTLRVQVKLYGSLAATGVGHATDKAILLGLMGFDPEHIDTQVSTSLIEDVLENKTIQLDQQKSISFDYKRDVLFR